LSLITASLLMEQVRQSGLPLMTSDCH